MLEVWADLYAMTGKQEHLDLVARYDRPRLFERLLAGEDPLTNRHANTTIPEAYGAARAFEVTGDTRWRAVVEAYWRCAVTERAAFCTGSQTNGEIWTPRDGFAARLGEKTQEHCVVYNMSRLADYLLRWTGEAVYADYIERNLYNGTLAQQNPSTGMVAYFLPLCGGARKIWGSPTGHFWCCHGSLVQAHTTHARYTAYAGPDVVALAQYIPTEIRSSAGGVPVTISVEMDTEACSTQACTVDGPEHRPRRWSVDVRVRAGREAAFTLRLRIPAWVAGEARLTVDGRAVPAGSPGSFVEIRRGWKDDHVRLELPMALTASPVPDDPETVAFLEGPVVLAGLCEGGTVLRGDPRRPEELLVPDNEREWGIWKTRYRTRGQAREISLVPLHEIVDEQYTTYFPVRGRQ